MTQDRSAFIDAMLSRGFMHQCTDLDGLDALARTGRLVAYVGYDCTADSLHIGNLVSVMMLRWLQRTGHKPIVLIGGGTTKIGDPSGKDEARKLLDEAGIARNIAGIRRSAEKFFSFGDGANEALMTNNAIWLDELRYIPFLRDIGGYFSVNRMLTMDSVRLRLEREQPLSFLEFNYMILQAYDFLELARRHGCVLQMGGSDQWGNIVGGVELGRRVENRTLYGLTTPLIATASGAKMGKTAQGAVWLNEDRLPVFDYWQFWRNTEDGDVGRFLAASSTRPRRSWPPRQRRCATAGRRRRRPPRPRAASSSKAGSAAHSPSSSSSGTYWRRACRPSRPSRAPALRLRTARRDG